MYDNFNNLLTRYDSKNWKPRELQRLSLNSCPHNKTAAHLLFMFRIHMQENKNRRKYMSPGLHWICRASPQVWWVNNNKQMWQTNRDIGGSGASGLDQTINSSASAIKGDGQNIKGPFYMTRCIVPFIYMRSVSWVPKSANQKDILRKFLSLCKQGVLLSVKTVMSKGSTINKSNSYWAISALLTLPGLLLLLQQNGDLLSILWPAGCICYRQGCHLQSFPSLTTGLACKLSRS